MTNLTGISLDVSFEAEVERPERDAEGLSIDQPLAFTRLPPPAPGVTPPQPDCRGIFTWEYMEKAIQVLMKTPVFSTPLGTREAALRKIHEKMGCPEYASSESMFLNNGGAGEDLKTAKELCAWSEPLYLERAPRYRPVVAPLRPRQFDDHVDADSWHTPSGGNSDYVLHGMDYLLAFCELGWVEPENSYPPVEGLEQKWVRRFGNAHKTHGVDATSVFNTRGTLASCDTDESELRSAPGGARFSRGKLERKARVVGYAYRRVGRFRPNAV